MDELTIDTYDQLAQKYDDVTAGFWDEFPPAFIGSFTDALPRPSRVLNAGSGPGRDGSLLYAAGLNVICLDASRKMVEMSKDRGLLSIQGDFMHIPFQDNEFEGVWAYTALLHVRKRKFPQALLEVGRVLRSGGLLGLGMIAGDHECYRRNSGFDLPRWFSYYQPEELAHHLVSAGFEVIEFEKFKPEHSIEYLNLLARKV